MSAQLTRAGRQGIRCRERWRRPLHAGVRGCDWAWRGATCALIPGLTAPAVRCRNRGQERTGAQRGVDDAALPHAAREEVRHVPFARSTSAPENHKTHFNFTNLYQIVVLSIFWRDRAAAGTTTTLREILARPSRRRWSRRLATPLRVPILLMHRRTELWRTSCRETRAS